MTDPGFMPSTASAVTSVGAWRPGTSAVVMTTSKLLDRVGQRLLLLRALLLGQLARVAALARRLDAEVEPLRAERLHLLGDLGAHVVAGRPRAEPPGRRERLQPGDAAAEHEHLRGRDRARGGHQHRVEARRVLGAEQRRLVAGDVRLRRQRVHRLRAADPRDRLHRERRDLRVGERARRLGRRQRREEADQERAVAELADLLARRRRDLDDDVGAPRVADLSPRPPRTARRGSARPRPRRASTTTSTSFAPRRLTTSGTIATRRSPSAVSLGTPTIIGGGKVSERPRRSRSAAAGARYRRGARTGNGRRASAVSACARDPDRCLGARARVADAAVRGDERAQVAERRARSAAPHAARVPARRDQRPGRPRRSTARSTADPGCSGNPPSGFWLRAMNAGRAGRPRRAATGPPRRAPGARRAGVVDAARRAAPGEVAAAVAVLLAARATTPRCGRSRRASTARPRAARGWRTRCG